MPGVNADERRKRRRNSDPNVWLRDAAREYKRQQHIERTRDELETWQRLTATVERSPSDGLPPLF